jgi:REP element-mobilizing transposase RayT
LLKFLRDRRRWRHWLFEAKGRYGLVVLNYIATSNHVHLLVVDQGNNEIAKSMQLVAARTAQEFNKRKKRNGAFWEDRYHATAVQSNQHLVRCLVYIDLNMVRAGVVQHPRHWEVGGYNEIQAPRRRKGIIDHNTLRRLTGMSDAEELRYKHEKWIVGELLNSRRNSIWTESVGVGDEAFLTDLKSQLGVAGYHKKIRSVDGVQMLREARNCYTWQF